MTRSHAELAVLVDDAARSVPGVTELYYAAALPARLWTTAVSRNDTFSAVSHREGLLDVTVSIGVSQGRADAIAGAVASRLREVVGEPTARVTVRVSRVTVP